MAIKNSVGLIDSLIIYNNNTTKCSCNSLGLAIISSFILLFICSGYVKCSSLRCSRALFINPAYIGQPGSPAGQVVKKNS